MENLSFFLSWGCFFLTLLAWGHLIFQDLRDFEVSILGLLASYLILPGTWLGEYPFYLETLSIGAGLIAIIISVFWWRLGRLPLGLGDVLFLPPLLLTLPLEGLPIFFASSGGVTLILSWIATLRGHIPFIPGLITGWMSAFALYNF